MKLFLLALKVQYFEWVELYRVFRRFSSHHTFLKAFLELKLRYLLDSPFQVSKRFLIKKKSDDLYLYGETPLTVLDDICEKSGLTSRDHVFELGAGSGFTSLWMAAFAGVRVTSIEQIPTFCLRLRRVSRRMKLDKLTVIEGDYLEVDLSGATVIYLYASNLDDLTIRCLTLRMLALKPGSKVISVSYPLQDYCPVPGIFEQSERFSARFPWGEADIFLQVRTSCVQKSCV
ncbi:SAM-dependent methyltransferase [Endozoicomonas sp. 8E]|uniref:SAM-dependent methyltransferase n=1 Tax=Endozoicomonas sp. 8E TaxID=3035692 RepID=UPI0029391DEE|nr:rRNA adenine N-6-methyltransferase family protein [Endozoicomonas sp. 8E]WOG29261.1 rRNA adenine N-6-methyltransferase family protein [Endozoicomonas sp. 8E]